MYDVANHNVKIPLDFKKIYIPYIMNVFYITYFFIVQFLKMIYKNRYDTS